MNQLAAITDIYFERMLREDISSICVFLWNFFFCGNFLWNFVGRPRGHLYIVCTKGPAVQCTPLAYHQQALPVSDERIELSVQWPSFYNIGEPLFFFFLLLCTLCRVVVFVFKCPSIVMEVAPQWWQLTQKELNLTEDKWWN